MIHLKSPLFFTVAAYLKWGNYLMLNRAKNSLELINDESESLTVLYLVFS